MSDVTNVVTKPSKTAGNGLFATKEISPGDTVLTIDRPLVAALDVPHLTDTCANCFTWTAQPEFGSTGDNPTVVKSCTGCQTVRYCTKVSKNFSHSICFLMSTSIAFCLRSIETTNI